MTVGGLAVIAAFVAAVLGAASGLRGRQRGLGRALGWATAFTVVAAGLLLAALLSNDFSLDYVVRHTSHELPQVYRLAAFWAGQEGTILLWVVLLELVAWSLARREGLSGPATTVTALVAGFLVLLIIRSPFALAALVGGKVPADGQGLNPLLRNPWMVVHPPVLFAGYALLAAPFALALAGFARGDHDGWLELGRRYLLAGWVALGAGMMLGGYWAYITLGWGGFWAWDPVENSSLIPWLFATALLHGLLVQRRSGALKRANFALAMVTFGTVVYGSYLTRSGVLGDFSVHSFETLGKAYNGAWLALLVAPLGAGLGLLVRCWDKVPEPEVPASLSWLSQAMWLVTAMGSFVLVGSSWPLISGWTGHAAAVEQAFYNRTQTGLFILGTVFLWLALRPRDLLSLALIASAAALGGWAAWGAAGTQSQTVWQVGLALLGAGCGAMAGLAVPRAVRQLVQRRWSLGGAAVAHAGAALLVLGAVLSGPGARSDKLELTSGNTGAAMHAGAEVTFAGERQTEDGKQALRLQAGWPGFQGEGEALVYETSQGLMRHPVLFHLPWGDLYLEPEEVSEAAPAATGEALELKKGETKELGALAVTFKAFDITGMHGDSDTVSVGAKLTVTLDGAAHEVTPRFIVGAGGTTDSPPETVGGWRIALDKVEASGGIVELRIQAPTAEVAASEAAGGASKDTRLVLRVTRKPWIWLVWLGTLLTLGGGALALVRPRVEAADGAVGP